jgi:hypothetical protein
MRRDERKRTGARGVSNYRQETYMPGYFSDDQVQIMNEIFDGFFEDLETEDSDIAVAAVIDYLLRRKYWYAVNFWSKYEAEDLLFDRHGFFDADIWSKVRRTDARRTFQRKAKKLAKKYLKKAVDEVVSANSAEALAS